MKRLQYFLTAVCFLFSMMAFSSVAFALRAGNVVYFDCPQCGVNHQAIIKSFSAATVTSSGSITFLCTGCNKEYNRVTHFWGNGVPTDFSVLGVGDVVAEYCSTMNMMETTFVYYWCAPRCSASGLYQSLHSSCNSATVRSFSSLSHSYSETRCTPATCTTSGSVLFTCTRSGCNETKTETIPALGHDYVSKRTDPTCTTPGSIVSTCSRCGDTTTEVLPALGHDYSVSARTDPTCTIPGSIVSTCSRCNDTITEELPVSYHSWDAVEMVPSVYDDDGSIITEGYTFYTCSTCGSHYTAVAGASPPAVGLVTDVLGGEGMPDTTAALGKTFLSGLWSLFGITVPGFNFTFGQMWLGVLLASVSILVIRMIFGFGGGPRGESPRTSSTSNPRISKERRRDEY